jgi:VanZ family protein
MRRAALWAPAVAQMAAIFGLSSIPHLTELPGNLSDHVGHAIGYGLLAAAALRGFAGGIWANVTAGAALRAWTLAVAYGATDEFHQRFVPGRTSSVDDLAADAIGAAVTLAIVAIGAAGHRREAREV